MIKKEKNCFFFDASEKNIENVIYYGFLAGLLFSVVSLIMCVGIVWQGLKNDYDAGKIRFPKDNPVGVGKFNFDYYKDKEKNEH